MKDDQKDGFFIEGTYASPRYFIPEDSPAHAEALKIFKKIKWAKPPKRDNGISSCQCRSKNPQKCRSNFPHFRDLVTSQIMRLSGAPFVVCRDVWAAAAV